MSLRYILVVLSLASLALAYSPTYTGDEYQSELAVDKQQQLGSHVYIDADPDGWYTLRTAEIFLEGMNTSFDFVGDDMPDQSLFDLEKRPKLIHSVGAVCNAQWKSTGDHPYTGVFQGSNNGFLRFSLAAAPVYDPPNTIPGISYKALRDGVESANLFAMYSLLGQSSFNFFEHDLTNHAPEMNLTTVDFAQRQLYKHFKTASEWPTLLGLSAMAKYDETGKEYNPPVFPFRLQFHATPQLHNTFPSAPSKDKEYFIPLFEQLSPGIFYEVWAQQDPNANLKQIGWVSCTNTPSGSNWGDANMFFQHTRMEDDFSYRPEWIAPTDAILDNQRATTPAYYYPDLPWN